MIDTKEIEERATNAIRTFFERSKVVSTFINDNDREPFWDGHLYLYDGQIRDKEHFRGRVPAQVKGKTMSVIKDEGFTYPIKKVDLRAYLKEGVAYFVVQETEEAKEIFCHLLTPLKIKALLNKNSDIDSVSVEMNQLAANGLKAFEIDLIQFEKACKIQSSIVLSDIDSDKILKDVQVSSFSLEVPVKDINEPFEIALTSSPQYIYGNINETVKLPIGSDRVWITLLSNKSYDVKVNDKTYYSQYEKKVERGITTINVGHCFSLRIDPEEKEGCHQANIKIRRGAKMLKEVINEAEFLLALQKYKELQIGKARLPIPFPDEHPLFSFLSECLPSWKELDETLGKIGANIDLDLDQIKTKKDETTLNVIVEMVGREHNGGLKNPHLGANNVRVGNLQLWFWVYEVSPKQYAIRSFFDKRFMATATMEYPEGKLEIGLYSWFNRDRLAACDNFPFDDVIPFYSKLLEANPHSFERANLLALEMMAVYDTLEENNPKKCVLLKYASKVIQWLMDNDLNDSSQLVYRLNCYQLKKRKGELSEEDLRILKTLQLSNAGDAMIQCGIALLIGDRIAFDLYWSQLSPAEKEDFKMFPIFIFTKDLK